MRDNTTSALHAPAFGHEAEAPSVGPQSAAGEVAERQIAVRMDHPDRDRLP